MNDIERPQWKSSYHVEILDERTLLLVDDRNTTLLTGRVYPLIAPLLDGTHTMDHLFAALGDQIFFPEIALAVRSIAREGHIVEGGASGDEAAAFWHALSVGMPVVQERLAATTVSVSALRSGIEPALLAALGRLGIRTTAEGDGDFKVVLVDDYLDPALASINRDALDSSRPWLLAKAVGNIVWIGPLFRPGSTGCHECLAQRLRANRQIENYLERRRGEKLRLPSSVVPSVVEAALQLVATETAKGIVLDSSSLCGRMLTFDAVTLQSQLHELIERPQCPACGDAGTASRELRPVVLGQAVRRIGNDGGVRVCTPEVTLARLNRHVSPYTGIVRTLEPTGNGSENGLTFSYAAGHNFALMTRDLRFVMQNLRGRSGGKGVTDAQAKVSAICEAIERYSGVYHGDEPERLATFEDIAHEALAPNDLMRFSDAQFDGREEWNERHKSGFHKVPERFDERRPVHWTPSWSLTRNRHVWIPSAYAYFGHPELLEWFFCTSDSNGNAAGNTMEEAILQGFLELVERDAVAMWWYNRVRRAAIDLESVDDPYIHALRDHYRQQQRELWALDITSDFGIPTIAAVSRRTGHPVEDIVIGFGAHLEPRIALLRAITEINQFMPAVEKRDAKGNTIYWFPEPEAVEWFKTAKLEENRFLAPGPMQARKLSDFGTHSGSDIADDVNTCVRLVEQRGMDFLVVDQTQRDIGLPVVKVMVPGMRHFWKRFGPGRLYDVPVQQGWVDSALREDQLNPIGVFF